MPISSLLGNVDGVASVDEVWNVDLRICRNERAQGYPGTFSDAPHGIAQLNNVLLLTHNRFIVAGTGRRSLMFGGRRR